MARPGIGPIIPDKGPPPRPKPTPAPKPPPPKPIGPTGSIRFSDEDARDIAAARERSDYGKKPQPTTVKKPSTPTPSTPTTSTPVNPGVDEAELERLRREQEERDRLAREAAERDAARREAERLAEEARKAARQYALARQPVLLPIASREPVKHAAPGDILIDDNELPIDLIIKLTLEKIGGIELISLVRHDTVNGQNIAYRPIKNVSQLAIEYNSQNLVKMPNSSDSYFDNFSIKLDSHMPQTTNILPPTAAYIDRDTENVIIELVNLKADYEIEVQMVSTGKVFDDTIYTEEN
jgi:hypothetical protein